jgi:hypothetical protein
VACLTVFKKGDAGKLVTNVGVTAQKRTVHLVSTISHPINILSLYAVLVSLPDATNETVAYTTKYYTQQDRQSTCNVTMRRVRVTTVTVEK